MNYTEFFTADDKLAYDEKAFDKAVKAAGAVELLTAFRTQVGEVQTFEPEPLEAFTQQFIAAQGKKIGELVHPLRVALTGKGVGLGLFDTLAILGRERSLKRIALAVERANSK